MRNLSGREILSLLGASVADRKKLFRFPFLSRDTINAWQLERVKKLVAFAYAQIPFYRKLYDSVSFSPPDLKSWKDFTSLPLVTKDAVIANFPRDMLKPGTRLDDLIVSRSSGSSGKVLDIAYDSRAMVTYIMAGLRLYIMGFPYRPWHRQTYIYTSPYPLGSLFGLYPLHFIHTLTPIPEIVARLRRIRPHLIVCYPSHLKQIARWLEAGHRREIRPLCISVNSEMSTQAERDALADFFGCPVLDEYSSEELTRIAAQCRSKNYHLFDDINYVEFIPEKGKLQSDTATIVGTNLHNYAMPMIRYVQNDLGAASDEKCQCGWNFRILVNLQGRRNDTFVMPSGRILSSGFLLDATYELLLTHRTAVRDFCLIQNSPASVLLQIVPGPGWGREVESLVCKRFRSFFEPGVEFAVQTVDECEKTKTGKRNPIISRVSRGETSP